LHFGLLLTQQRRNKASVTESPRGAFASVKDSGMAQAVLTEELVVMERTLSYEAIQALTLFTRNSGASSALLK
jgi:hypothetical protein